MTPPTRAAEPTRPGPEAMAAVTTVCLVLIRRTTTVSAPLNTSVEVLARSSIPHATRGKVWGLLGLVPQLGYLAAYAVAGVLADFVFNPPLVPGGALAGTLGTLIGVGSLRGIGPMSMVVGVPLVVLAVVISRVKGIRTMQAHQERRVRDTIGVRP